VIIVLNLFQFIFIEPPFIFSVILWSLSFLSLVITFWNYITTFWMWIWITMLLLFLLASFDNLILYATSPEITGILLLAVAGVIFAAVVLFNRHKKELKEKGVLFFFGLLFLMELASVIANIYGRYNLSKNLMTTGYSNAIIGFLFLWTIRCINDGLAIASLV
jgi:small-conductance mechanosensitive channel